MLSTAVSALLKLDCPHLISLNDRNASMNDFHDSESDTFMGLNC